jgi:hypothetical protein
MEMSCQRHIPAPLPEEKEPLGPISSLGKDEQK